LGVLENRIFTSAHMKDHEMQHFGMVFVPAAMGALSDWPKSRLEEIGVFWEENSKALPRGVNGLPMFMSMHLMHKDDWARATKAIEREQKRRETIEI